MKSLKFFLAFTVLPLGLALAQTKPASVPATPTNRQQELYDEHHGITKKPAKIANTPATSSPADRTPAQRPAEVATRPEHVESNTSGVRIGIRGGVTYPVFTETTVGVDPAIGFVGGITFNFGRGAVSFQPEINYTRYASKVTAFGVTTTQGADVVEVPLFLKFSTGTYAGNRFFVNVGPYVGYALNISENGKTISLDGAKGRFGFGAGAGIGAALKAGPGHVTIEVRGLYPLGDIDNGFSTDSKTIFGQGTLGYIFPLGGR